MQLNSAIVLAAAEGVVQNCDSNLLRSKGGHISLSKDWAKGFLHRLGYIITSAKVSVSDFEAYRAQFVFDVQTIVEVEEIPK